MKQLNYLKIIKHFLHSSAVPTNATTTMAGARTSAAGINMNALFACVQLGKLS